VGRVTVITVDDPLDPLYPFDEKLYANEQVVYHGTWSTYCASIESVRMGKGRLAYKQVDIDTLCKIGRRFGFFGKQSEGGLSVLMPCAEGVPEGKRAIYLSRNYWSARNYAHNRGGEAIRHAAIAIAHLEKCFACPDL
jgi:hypothetical protein